MASRAFTARFTSAVSNWLTSASVWQGWRHASVSMAMRAPIKGRIRSDTSRTLALTSNTWGLSGWRRAKARSWLVSLAARSTVSAIAST